MNSFSCKRFRRFENLEPIEFKGVNFFVGANNSGKSSVVKAIILILDNLCNNKVRIDPKYHLPLFDLSSRYAHIGEFKRAIRKTNDIHSDVDDTIEFEFVENGHIINVVICDSSINNYYACYKRMCIKHIGNEGCIDITADFEKKIISYSCGNSSDKLKIDEDRLNHFFDKLIEFQVDINEKTRRVSNAAYDYKNNKKARLTHSIDDLDDYKNKISLFFNNKDNIQILNVLIDNHKNNNGKYYFQRYISFSYYDDNICRLSLYKPIFDSITEIVKSEIGYINECLHTYSKRPYKSINFYQNQFYIDTFDKFRYLYIFTHGVHQNSVFSTLDKNDYIAKAIHDFHKIQVDSWDERSGDFMETWLQKFEIGKWININPIPGGEIYTVSIDNMDDVEIPLQDLGIGAIQIVYLLLHLAVFISDLENQEEESKIIIIEEPEQNLHPKLQTTLAELFCYINQYPYLDWESELDSYGETSRMPEFLPDYQIIVETHSEYMIRRTQSIIAEGGFDLNGKWIKVECENNPFQVYYFPKEGQPYSLGYQKSGLFKRPFGEGFFDESSKLLLPVLRKARDIK